MEDVLVDDARELAVGGNSREVTEENLEDVPVEDVPVEEVLEVTETPPNVFFVPKLLTAPVEDVLVLDDARVPILLPLAMAVVGQAGAIDDFFLGPRDGGPILAFDSAGLVEALIFVTVGFGILLAIAGAGAFPRFHTF